MNSGKMKNFYRMIRCTGHDVYYSISTFSVAFVTAHVFAGTPHEDAMIALACQVLSCDYTSHRNYF